MPLKKHASVEIIGTLREVEIMLAQGGTTHAVCRLPPAVDQRANPLLFAHWCGKAADR